MSRALVLRHHVEDDAGLIGLALVARGYTLTTVMVNSSHLAPRIKGFDLVVMLGSNSSVYDLEVQHAWLNQELAVLREYDRSGGAILGICFGAQALCHLFGGDVERAPEGEVGWITIDVEPGRELMNGPWFEHHGDRCVLSPRAKLWASSPLAVQAFSVGRHLGVQFHPEIDDEQLGRWFASTTFEPRAHDENETELLEETRRQTPAATIRAQELVDLFLKHAGL